MWLLIVLLAINAVLNESIILNYRFFVAGLPINILDILMALCLIAAVFVRRREEHDWAPRVHPLFWVTMLLFTAALVVGTIEGGLGDIPARWVLMPMRNLATLPLIIFCAYRLVDSPSRAMLLLKTLVWSSAASAVFALLFVSHTAESVAEGSNFDQFRTVSVGGDLGILAASVILFGLASRTQLYGKWRTIGLLIVGVMGTLALPHRSAWVTSAVTLLYAMFFLHRRDTIHKLMTGTMILAILAVVAWGGILALSKVADRDYGAYVEHRLLSFLPEREHFAGPEKPWDTRLPGLIREFELWTERPITGQGFGIQDVEAINHPAEGYRHNVWTSTLAETGLIGFSGMCCLVFGLLVVGFRMANDRVDVCSVLMGAAGSSIGVWSFLLASFTMSLNIQRCALAVGIVFGALLKTRAMQLSALRGDQPGATHERSPADEQAIDAQDPEYVHVHA